MKRHELIAHLQSHGACWFARGAALLVGHPGKNRRSSVPRHAEIPDPLARKISRDLAISEP